MQEFTIFFGTLLALWLVGQEYCLASLRFIFCLSDRFCLFLVSICIFLGWRSKALTSAVFWQRITRPLQNCRRHFSFSLERGRGLLPLPYIPVCECVSLCVVFKCKRVKNILVPQISWIELRGHLIMVYGIALDCTAQKELWALRCWQCNQAYLYKAGSLPAWVSKWNYHWLIGICRLTKQSNFIRHSLPQCVCFVSVDLFCQLSRLILNILIEHYFPLSPPPLWSNATGVYSQWLSDSRQYSRCFRSVSSVGGQYRGGRAQDQVLVYDSVHALLAVQIILQEKQNKKPRNACRLPLYLNNYVFNYSNWHF